MKKISMILVALATILVLNAQKYEGLADTPPMGWNSWNTFHCDVNEKLIRDVADVFERDGYIDAGYEYIIIDDCWALRERDENGNLVPDTVKFPSGIKALADYVHSKGLKFGIYSDAGTKTCAGYPGSKGFEIQDAKLFASWGVDYLKYDWCNTEGQKPQEAYKTISDALFATGRPIILGICEWGTAAPWLWGKNFGQLWRISGDIATCFDCIVDHGSYKDLGVMKIVYMREGIRKYAGPNSWNDFDMMEVGNGMTAAEDRAHFSLWCMLASPLIMGNDIRNANQESIEIQTNEYAIAINQDPLGIQAFKYINIDSTEVWVKPLENDEWAICFLNRKNEPVNLEFDWNMHKINDPDFNYSVNFGVEKFKLFDVWDKRKVGNTKKPFKKRIGAHDICVLWLNK
ncbi:MAG: glycoside hydrolase family 27 protein [Prolixibacteraceae bacterium]|nr:glycoside hydrolase family 27 protein [Prolixibacteraceae bacterium]